MAPNEEEFQHAVHYVISSGPVSGCRIDQTPWLNASRPDVSQPYPWDVLKKGGKTMGGGNKGGNSGN